MKLVFEKFDSLGQYLNVISTREPNKVFKNCRQGSNDTDASSYNFTRTNSYAEATDLAYNGYKEGLDKLKASDSKSRYTGSAPKALPATSVIGFAPHVPNAITGVPNSMITTHKVEQKAKVISILYNMDGAACIDADSFIKAGKNLLNVIYTLELQGYRVALEVMSSFNKPDESAICLIQIKNWRQPSNPLKMAYPLVHPSFMRRHGFRWLETTPSLSNESFPFGYGRALENHVSGNIEKRRKWLKEQGVLQENCFYTERLEAESNEADKLIELMGITKDAEKPKAKKYSPKRRYETTRGAGLDFDNMGLPDSFHEPDDLPSFGADDLRR